MFASKCQGVECHAVRLLGVISGILAGGIPGFRIEPLLLRTPFLMAIFCGVVLFWFVFAFQMACAKDGTQAAIGIHLKST